MITPFGPDGQVDHEIAARLARYLVDRGSTGLVLSGTTGEAPALSDQEKLALFVTVARAIGNRAQVLAGTGTNDTAHSVELTREAAKVGVHGILAVTPYYNKPTQSGLVGHFTAIADASELPVMLYNIPSRTAQLIELETLSRLAEHPRIVAVKDATMDLDHTSRLVTEVPDLAVFSGQDSYTLPMLSVGAVGVVSVISHLAGSEVTRMVKAALAGNYEDALHWHQQLLDLCWACFLETNPGPIKSALQEWWGPVGPPRLPLVAANSSTMESIRQALEKISDR